jgi:hypothetical protein
MTAALPGGVKAGCRFPDASGWWPRFGIVLKTINQESGT